MLLDDRLIDVALAEDIGTGDVTTDALIPEEQNGKGVMVAKQALVVCGTDIAARVFQRLDPEAKVHIVYEDGDQVRPDQAVMAIEGSMAALLKAERTALNFLQRLSGIATQTRRYVKRLGRSRVRLVDTRKTTPGWRVLEKYAVRTGGGANHRMGLYDGVLIKDNHIIASGGVTQAIGRARRAAHHLLRIEVEVSTLEEVREALTANADVIMLDNMAEDDIRSAVKLINGRALVEVSGNVTQNALASLADTGVDVISVGALTHQARAVDLSMRVTPV
jgi:nicotinate-nucleotide pyrophosphorylase (carboxylating)